MSFTTTSSFVRLAFAALLFLSLPVLATPGITISSVSSSVGVPLSGSITLNGAGFNDTTSRNVVWIGGMSASVTAASATALTVTIPLGAGYSNISVTNLTTRQSAIYGGYFQSTFDPSCYVANSLGFKPKQDIAVSGAAPNSHPGHCATGDLDGDGYPDLVVSSYDSIVLGISQLFVYRNQGIPGRISYDAPVILQSGAGGNNIKLADLDGDGKLDIVVACNGSAVISCLRNTSSGTGVISFATKADLHPQGGVPEVAIADFDGDGRLDIAGIVYSTSRVKVFRNVMSSVPVAAFPSTAFITPTTCDSFQVVGFPAASGSIAAADFDGDGRMDIVVSNTADGSVSLLRNISTLGAINFESHVEFPHAGLPTEVQAADLDGDGKPEIIVGDYSSPAICIYNNTSASGVIDAGSFARLDVPLTDSAYGLSVGDVDGNGTTDIVISRWYANSLAILKNRHTSGTLSAADFVAGDRLRTGSRCQGLSIADLDGDTKSDIVVANYNDNSISILESVGTPQTLPIDGMDSVCLGSSVTLTSAHCTNGAGYWYSTNGHANVTAGAADTIGIVTGASVGTDTIVYAVVHLYDTAFIQFPIDVKALADTGVISGPDSVCLNAQIILSETVVGGTWSSSDTSVLAVDAVSGAVTGRNVGSALIYYTTQSFSCGPLSASHMVTVKALPDAGVITGPNGTCVGSSITLTASVAGGTWVNLYPAVAADVPSGLNNVITGLSINADTILYIATSFSCGSDTAFKQLGIVEANISLPILGDTITCINDTVQLANGASGGSWSVADPLIATVDETTGQVIGLSAGTTQISYTVSYSCGPVDTFINFTVRPLPAAGTISGPTFVCVGNNITLTVSGASAVGSWFTSNALVSTVSPGTGVVLGVTPGVNTIYYRVNDVCGFVDAAYPDTVLAFPSPDTIVGATSICPGATLTLTTVSGNVSETWATSDAAIATVTAGVVTAGTSGEAIISYTISTACGLVSDTAIVTVYPQPTIAPVADQAVCNGSASATVFTGAVAGTSFAWTNSNIVIGLPASGSGDTLTFTGTNTTDSVISSTVIVTPTANTCIGTSDTFNIAVMPTPVLSSADTFTLCDSVAFAYTPSTTTSGVSFAWSRAAVSGIANPAASDTGSILEYLVNTTTLPVTVVYTYTLTINGCTNQQTISITVNPRPLLSSSLTPPDVCSHKLFSYVPSCAIPGAAFSWSRDAVAGISNVAATGTNDPNEVLLNTTTATVPVYYVYTVSANSCSYAQMVTVNVKPKTSLTSVLADTVCSGIPFYYTANATVSGTTYAWTRAAVTGLTPATGAGTSTISDTLTNSSFTRLNAVYVFSLTANACTYVENVTLTLDPLPAPFPQIAVHSPSALCSGTMYQNFGTAATPADTIVQYIWTADNAVVYATGSSDQYSLVNFPYPGNAMVHVTANVKGIGCYLADSFAVNVSSSVSDQPTVLYFNNTQFVCLPSDEDTYQWGYDDAQLDSTILTGQVNQDYINPSPDFSKYYWVMTSKDGCTQKTYYKIPTGINDVAGSNVSLNVFPNPTNDLLTIDIGNATGSDYSVVVFDVIGRKMKTAPLNGTKTSISVADLAAGAYLVSCYSSNGKVATVRFIKN